MTETEWAIRNLELAGLFGKDSDYDGMLGESVKELLEVIGKQGHSGFSHAQTLRIFNHVVNGKALSLPWWLERFDSYNRLSALMGGGAWTEAEFEKIAGPKPHPRDGEV